MHSIHRLFVLVTLACLGIACATPAGNTASTRVPDRAGNASTNSEHAASPNDKPAGLPLVKAGPHKATPRQPKFARAATWVESPLLVANAPFELTRQQLEGACRRVSHIRYAPISTPWGSAELSLTPDAQGLGLVLSMTFQGPPSATDDGAWARTIRPDAGKVEAVMVWGNYVVQESLTPVSAFSGWRTESGRYTGTMQTSFDWLEANLDDYWLCLDLAGQRFWLLIPYGAACDPTALPEQLAVTVGSPAVPTQASATDEIVTWESVWYDLGEITSSKWKVSMALRNNEAPEFQFSMASATAVELFKPVLNAVLMVPGAPIEGLERSYVGFDGLTTQRTDRLESKRLAREGGRAAGRSWGLIQVQLGSWSSFVAVPSSTFVTGHGKAQ